MKFLGDMSISPQSIAFLRDQHIEAVHLYELGLARLPDLEIVQKAQEEGYVILTHDLDFGELLALSGNNTPSIVIFRLRNMRPHNVNRYLQILVTEHQSALDEGVVVTVEEARIRVRRLPIS